MPKIIKDKYDFNVFIRNIKNEGNNYFTIKDNRAILYSCIELSPEISADDKKEIINNAISLIKQKKSISIRQLEATLHQEENNFLNKPFKKYTLATSLSLQKSARFLPYKVVTNNCQINLGFNYPASINRTGIRFNQTIEKDMGKTMAYSRLWITTKARNNTEAISKIFEELDFIRGIWNLSLNCRNWARTSSMPRPVNNLTLGPVHTLHDNTGKPATNTYWYELFFSESVNVYTQTAKFIKALEEGKKIRKKMRNHNYGFELRSAIIRYCRALDHIDYEASYLKLWSTLELLTDTMNYENTIKRVAFLFANNEFHKQVLQHLREQRNLYVHHGIKIENAETILFQLKRYVERLLYFNIFTKYNFQSIKELGDFLSISTDKIHIRSEIKKLTRVLKFLK